MGIWKRSTSGVTFTTPDLSPRSDMTTPQTSPEQVRFHPYAPPFTMKDHSVVDDSEKVEEECPVCLEPLSFRLAGEKPHVVPVCGHRLHEACFEEVYGSVVRARNRSGHSSLGLCGVCRRDMKLGDPTESGKTSSSLDPPHFFRLV